MAVPRRLVWLPPLLLVALLLVAGCAAGPNTVSGPHAPAGFWLGLWQGLIVPITFLVSLFNNHVSIYEVRNNGNWYDFGYVLGIYIVFGSVLTGARRR